MTSTKEVAEMIFKNPPVEPGSCSLLVDEINTDDVQYTFELILTIYMEGIMILYNNLEGIDLTMIKEEHLMKPDKWFESLGIKIMVYNVADEDYYCKVALKADPKYKIMFAIKNINKEYHFLFNSKYWQDGNYAFPIKQLDKMRCLFVNGTDSYSIGFRRL